MAKNRYPMIFLYIGILILLLNLFVLNIQSRLLIMAFILIYTSFAFRIFKYKQDSLYLRKSVSLTIVICGLLQMGFFYLFSLKEGYATNVITLNKGNVNEIVVPVIITIFVSEVLRYIFSSKYDNFRLKSLSVIFFILLDVTIFGAGYNLKEMSSLLEFLGLVLFPSIIDNVIFTKIVIDYGYRPIIGYRLATILTLYIVPVIPKLNILFRSIGKMLAPVLLFFVINFMYSRKEFENISRKNMAKKIAGYSVIIIVTLFIALVSCKFEYSLITIGSGSMTGTINKGDAVIYQKYHGENLNIGDIVIYERKGNRIVHRIIEVGVFNNQYVYTFKGDANKYADEWYIYQKDIVGVYKARVPKAGWPSLWFRLLFGE